MATLQRRAPDLVAAAFGISSIVHLVRPTVFEPLIPSWLPAPRTIVEISGVAEAVCAIALVRRWRWSGIGSALLLVAIFPGNIQMAANAVGDARGRVTANEVLTIARLPFQGVLIWAALQARRGRVATPMPLEA